MLKPLEKSIKRGKLAQAYLFVGQGVGEEAAEFAQKIGVSDFDIHFVEPQESGSIGIGQIQDLQKSLSLKSYKGKYKVAVIKKAPLLTRQAANCLLKTLEEPVGQTVLVLCAQDKHQLLPTIVSRCRVINFSQEIKRQASRPQDLTEDNLKDWLFYWRTQMLSQPNQENLNTLKEFLRVHNLLDKTNVNPKITINYLRFLTNN